LYYQEEVTRLAQLKLADTNPADIPVKERSQEIPSRND